MNKIILGKKRLGGEMVDTRDSKFRAAKRGGSSPLQGINFFQFAQVFFVSWCPTPLRRVWKEMNLRIRIKNEKLQTRSNKLEVDLKIFKKRLIFVLKIFLQQIKKLFLRNLG